jgi:hypothetical protein
MTKTHTATAIAGPTRFMITLAELLTSDIDAEVFADRQGTTINHPAFVLGHCGYYLGVCMQLLGSDIELSDDEKTLYEHGAECVDDASRYPNKDAAIARFNERVVMAADFIESCNDTALAQSSAETPFAERFPTMGGVAAFMMVGHVPFHLGQISAWRRIAGMGSAT